MRTDYVRHCLQRDCVDESRECYDCRVWISDGSPELEEVEPDEVAPDVAGVVAEMTDVFENGCGGTGGSYREWIGQWRDRLEGKP